MDFKLFTKEKDKNIISQDEHEIWIAEMREKAIKDEMMDTIEEKKKE